MANLYSQKTYDAAMALRAAGLIAASADCPLILDLGDGLMKGDIVLDVSACEINTGDESYEIIAIGSSDAAFGTAANIEPLASISIGHHSSTRLALMKAGADAASGGTGRYLIPFRNERNGTLYRYLRLTVVVVGTIATGINFSAWLAKDD